MSKGRRCSWRGRGGEGGEGKEGGGGREDERKPWSEGESSKTLREECREKEEREGGGGGGGEEGED